MAIFRATLKSGNHGTGIYEAFASAKTDLTADPTLPMWGAGSVVYCTEDDKIYIKMPDGSWHLVPDISTEGEAK